MEEAVSARTLAEIVAEIRKQEASLARNIDMYAVNKETRGHLLVGQDDVARLLAVAEAAESVVEEHDRMGIVAMSTVPLYALRRAVRGTL